MARKRKDKDVASVEYLAFEELAKKVLGVPKKELDRREAEAKQAKQKPPVS